MYKLIDYYTQKRINCVNYRTEKEALIAEDRYLTEMMEDKVIHNNLIIIKKYEKIHKRRESSIL